MYPLNHHWLSISATNSRCGVFFTLRGESLAAPCSKLRLLWHWLSSVFVRERNNLHASRLVESVTPDGMKGCCEEKYTALRESGRAASKQARHYSQTHFQTLRLESVQALGGGRERISCRVNNATEGVRGRTVRRNRRGSVKGKKKKKSDDRADEEQGMSPAARLHVVRLRPSWFYY